MSCSHSLRTNVAGPVSCFTVCTTRPPTRRIRNDNALRRNLSFLVSKYTETRRAGLRPNECTPFKSDPRLRPGRLSIGTSNLSSISRGADMTLRPDTNSLVPWLKRQFQRLHVCNVRFGLKEEFQTPPKTPAKAGTL